MTAKEAGRATIKEIIRLTKEYAMAGNVFISHAFGLNDFEGAERTEVFQALADRDIHIVFKYSNQSGTIPPLKITKLWGCCSHWFVTIFHDSWSSLGDGSLQEKLARYLEILAFNHKRH